MIGLSLIGCTQSSKNYQLTKLNELKFGQTATLMGVYTKNVIAQKTPSQHRGLYKIVVNDTLEVMLLPPYEKAAVRLEAEVARFEGKKVIVTGRIEEITSVYDPLKEEDPPLVWIPNFATIERISLAR